MNKGFLSMVIFFISMSSICFAMSQLEESYKTQMEKYNTDIDRYNFHYDLYKQTASHARDMADLCSKEGEPCYSKYESKIAEEDKKMDDAYERLNQSIRDKNDLKIRILEKFGRLPNWWKDEKKTVPQQ